MVSFDRNMKVAMVLAEVSNKMFSLLTNDPILTLMYFIKAHADNKD